MPEYITLIGSEGVERAGGNISEAADTIRRAASSMTDAVQQLDTIQESFLSRFEELVQRLETALQHTGG